LNLLESDLEPFNLSSPIINRPRRNDVSFITKDNKLIIFVEHQTTLSPNFGLKLLLYYFEVIVLWLKKNNINIHGTTEVISLPEPVFCVVFNGKATKEEVERAKKTMTTFKQDYAALKVDVKVELVDIRFDELSEEEKQANNTLAGYSFFYNQYDQYISDGLTRDEAIAKACEDCIGAGYLKGIIDGEEFLVMYRDILSYDAQLEARGEERAKAETALEMLNDGFSIEQVAKYTKMPISWVERLTIPNNANLAHA
jgi:hypothetical protein